MRRMMMLSELIPDVLLRQDVQVCGLVQDSRDLQAGDAFVALAGFGMHGLMFAEQVKARGASAVLFDPAEVGDMAVPVDAVMVPHLRGRLGKMAGQFYGHPSQVMTMVGVTGTNGKTSTVQMLTQAWGLEGVCGGSIGTLGAGLYGNVVATGFTTPLVLKTHELLARLHDEGAQAVAMEVSSHALDQGRVDEVHFNIGVFTNLTRDHLDYHGDMAHYAAAKAKLFLTRGLEAAVINVDDEFGRKLLGDLPETVRGIGISSKGDLSVSVRAECLRQDISGLSFDLVIGGEKYAVHSSLLGRFNVDNLLAVAGVLYAQNYAVEVIAKVLARLQPISGRMSRLVGADARHLLVVVDYAHTPDALEQALMSLRNHTHGRVLCVFGCGGERDKGKRPQMGAIAEKQADVVWVTDDNPRGESGDAIVGEIKVGFSALDKVHIQRDRRKAIREAIAAAKAGDVVLIAGKGHELYQEVAGVRHAFNDMEVAYEALEVRQ